MSEELVEQPEVQKENENKVDFEAYEKTKNDMHLFKRKFMDTQEKLNEYQKEIEALKEQNLQKSENYKELWEKEREARQKVELNLKQFSSSVIEDKKMAAIEKEALTRGMDKEFLDLLPAFDTSEVLVETTDSGKFVVNGADTWVESLLASRPKLMGTKSDPAINNKNSNYSGKEKTYTSKEILELEKSDPAKYQDIMTNKRHLIK